MTSPADDKPAGRPHSQVVLRGFGMVLAVGLGALAIWLIVTTDTRKGATVGALLGFWALLVAAFAVFGTRHPLAALAPVQDVGSRPGAELTRVEDATTRRDYEYRLMEMLRREITATMSSELVTLRADVAALRGELVEKVGGQIRLERIETTRVIGSDIEALQHEVRQMMLSGRQLDQLGPFSLGSTHTALVATAGPVAAEPLQAEPSSPAPVGPQPSPPAPATPPVPTPPEPIAPEPPPPVPTPPEPIAPEPPPPVPVPTPPTPPVPTPPVPPVPIEPVPIPPQALIREQTSLPLAEPIMSNDPFASMPRLSRFTDVDPDPIEAGSDYDDPYAGRRRQNGGAGPAGGRTEPVAPSGRSRPAEPGSGRHTNANGDAIRAGDQGAAGRRRRAANGADDVLARVRSRDTSR